MKARVVFGFVLLAGSSLELAAQDFIDLEAERRSDSAQTRPIAPVQSAPQSLPDSPVSYGIDGSVATTRQSVLVQSADAAPAQDAGSLFVQVQRLAEEVRRLNGIVEEQANQIKMLQEQSLERYLDLDRRLASGATAVSSSAGSEPTSATPSTTVKAPTTSLNTQEEPAYLAARQKVYDKQFDDAVAAFNSFLLDYPSGAYAPNAHYWLGELYLVLSPPDLELSRQAFQLLLDLYPQHNKVPDATYKLATVYFAKGNPSKARELLDVVIVQYGSKNHPAAKLAQQFLDNNF